jgi:flavin reductase (DIM6/NTAB) family NADH-FMN oxidoreductase RutF
MAKRPLGSKTMAYPLPVWCVGSYDKDGKPNLATVAWGGICCSKPPCVTISLRKATYTYGNILEREAYTVNIPSAKYVAEADFFGTASGRNVDKFKQSGITPVRSDLVDAPYADEFPVILECKVLHHFEIGLHTQFIGEILDVKADESVLDDAGKPDIAKIDPIVYSTKTQGYHRVGEWIGGAYDIGSSYSKK